MTATRIVNPARFAAATVFTSCRCAGDREPDGVVTKTWFASR